MDNNTVGFALRSMCFLPYTHIVVRRHSPGGVEVLGGGYLGRVLSRYGGMELERSFISNNILYVDVK